MGTFFPRGMESEDDLKDHEEWHDGANRTGTFMGATLGGGLSSNAALGEILLAALILGIGHH